MRLVPILIALLLLPSVAAYQINTTVTIDYIGNDNAVLRTEIGDFPFNVNSSNQIDQSFMLNLTRQLESNLTEGEQILGYLINFSSAYMNMSQQYNANINFTRNEYNELLANWTRCNLDKNALMAQVPVFESLKQNQTKQVQDCIALQSSLQSTINTYSQNYIALSANITALQKKASDNTLLKVVIGAAIVSGIWFFQNYQKKSKAHPDEMTIYGS